MLRRHTSASKGFFALRWIADELNQDDGVMGSGLKLKTRADMGASEKAD